MKSLYIFHIVKCVAYMIAGMALAKTLSTILILLLKL